MLNQWKGYFSMANSSAPNSAQFLSQEQIKDLEQLGNEVVRLDCLKGDMEHALQMACCIASTRSRLAESR